MTVVEQKTTDVLKTLFNEVDVTDLGYTAINFMYGDPKDISLRLNNRPNNFPLVIMYYSDLKESFSFGDSNIYLNSNIKLYVMLPGNFKKLDQSEEEVNAIDVAQTIIHRFRQATDDSFMVNEVKEFDSNPLENWNVIISQKNIDGVKMKSESEFAFDLDLSGRDMRFQLDVYTKLSKCT